MTRREAIAYAPALVGITLLLIGGFVSSADTLIVGGVFLSVSVVVLVARLFVKPPEIVDVLLPGLPPNDESPNISHKEASEIIRDKGAQRSPGKNVAF